jgi:hypothetical protein
MSSETKPNAQTPGGNVLNIPDPAADSESVFEGLVLADRDIITLFPFPNQ